MGIDFIVHPRWVILSKNEDEKLRFVERMTNLINDGAYVVYSYGGLKATSKEDHLLQKKLPYAKKGRDFVSQYLLQKGSYYPFGHVDPEGFKDLKNIGLTKKDEIRIHGCFYPLACPVNLAFQLFGMLYAGKNMYDWTYLTNKQLKMTNIIEIITEAFQCLAMSNIRYGSVYSNEDVGTKEYKRTIPNFLGWKEIDFQLTDSKTEIFGTHPR